MKQRGVLWPNLAKFCSQTRKDHEFKYQFARFDPDSIIDQWPIKKTVKIWVPMLHENIFLIH